MNKLEEYLLKKSNLTKEDWNNKATDTDFELINNVLLTIHTGKEQHYGDYVESLKNDSLAWASFQNLAEIKRKFNRASRIVNKAQSEITSHSEFMLLMETYADLAIYAILGVNLIASRTMNYGKHAPGTNASMSK